MVTIIILATLLTLIISMTAGAYKIASSNISEKLHTDANIKELSGWGKRGQRAMENHLETYVSFMALAVLVVYLGDRVGADDITRFAVLGGWIYLAFRTLHWLCFTFAVPYLRTAAWALSTIGIAMVGWAVFQLAMI